ncbi:hypothetical protein VOLCADRAFT_96077 [Volvox carteri f. nagariensis]|uniref:Peptidase M11 gametolysin domain-containing protein n=1 Tax=Volvox carteri f. nagariensis TaxID=3068 RepID=D8U954_VOLCA|nr:uncharacterized protein VOLCADRAFT_96077 [Volvox carteri f. nagariensis]EFJ43692.1 hypothetical protein VOLCADRAFT_96077 [Volvox carteri f. nagariensis]|eukprot:XP_002955173.1 hypothetical protein VOLCADRAFT_96077 [Volvox carteri f. nagariensis]
MTESGGGVRVDPQVCVVVTPTALYATVGKAIATLMKSRPMQPCSGILRDHGVQWDFPTYGGIYGIMVVTASSPRGQWGGMLFAAVAAISILSLSGAVSAVPVQDTDVTGSAAERHWRRELLFGNITSSRRPSFVVYITTFCGHNQAADKTAEDVRRLFFGSGDSRGRNMQNYIGNCSYGQIQIGDLAVLGPVEIPCNEPLDMRFAPVAAYPGGNNVTSTFCDGVSSLKWQTYLEAYALTRGVIARDFQHRVMILPRGTDKIPGCAGPLGWADTDPWIFSDKNPYGSSIMFLKAEAFETLELWLHEAGHNMRMQHASVPNFCSAGDQCDYTCTMGFKDGQGIRCLNAPHNWQPLLLHRSGDLLRRCYASSMRILLIRLCLLPTRNIVDIAIVSYRSFLEGISRNLLIRRSVPF